MSTREGALRQETSGDGKPGSPRAEPARGRVFVLAGGGLRHLGRGEPGAPEHGDGFLGYRDEDLFWKDMFEVAHPDEERAFRDLVSDVVKRPGVSVGVKLRMLDSLGRWRWIEATVQNVLEAPDGADGGLLAVNIRDLSGAGG